MLPWSIHSIALHSSQRSSSTIAEGINAGLLTRGQRYIQLILFPPCVSRPWCPGMGMVRFQFRFQFPVLVGPAWPPWVRCCKVQPGTLQLSICSGT